ncbi:hypothetical protein QFW77_02665 [Luteimonas sp. RD2P54]|uniref:Nuclear transport factor 2 family protein n=1 Tax=Luteimonas endophytica TaxID=3042023 RepID=A0ABT6J502_9GAMM|nr:hypothetical protein [Luteimonas endophytica]MDH5821898.1 hypothetical protein [Luteimonas endophytica]
MKQFSFFLFGCILAGCTWQPVAQAAQPCIEDLASDLLEAVMLRDEQALKAIANNPDVFDDVTIEYMIGDASTPFHGRADLRSAYSVLEGGRVLTKVAVTESQDGSKMVEVIYLPTSTAPDFVALTKMATTNRAIPFRDYVMCSIVVRDGSASMPHACYAETDALD